MQTKPNFNKIYPFLGIYQPKQDLNDNTFHYYTEPQPGFHRVFLHRKSAKKQLCMYYEEINLKQSSSVVAPDTSGVLDFQYFSVNDNVEKTEIVEKGNLIKDSEWVKKYEPSKFTELLTDDKINRNLAMWVKSWQPIVFQKNTHSKKNTSTPTIFNRNLNNKTVQPGDHNSYLESIFSNPKKMILLAGPPGCGKTTLMRVLAKHYKYEIVQINASDDRSANNLIDKLENIAGNDTMRGNKKPAFICLDEIDGVADGEANGIAKILEYLENGKKIIGKKNENGEEKTKQKTKPETVPQKQNPKGHLYHKNVNTPSMKLNRPVIFICNDPYSKSLKDLRSKAHVVFFSQLGSERVVKRMRQICEKQKIVVELQVLQKIAELCNNDIRSCIGILQLVSKQKRFSNKNPKDTINKLKFSFTKDNQSSINDFLSSLFNKKNQSISEQRKQTKGNTNIIKHIQTQVMEIYNPSLLMEYFLQNLLSVAGVTRKGKYFLSLYDDLVVSDMLIKNGFKNQGELQNYHVLPYLNFAFNFGSEDIRKIEFPHGFFERLRKIKWNKQILKNIYANIPIQCKIYLKKDELVGPYLLSLYLGMQTSFTRDQQITKCVSLMLTYGFNVKKEAGSIFPIFNPDIDALLTIGQRKPEILITNVTRSLIEQNYEFFKQRKDMLVDNQLRDNTTAMINQMHIHSRKKKIGDPLDGIKYKFLQGTGTKTRKNLRLEFFFK